MQCDVVTLVAAHVGDSCLKWIVSEKVLSALGLFHVLRAQSHTVAEQTQVRCALLLPVDEDLAHLGRTALGRFLILAGVSRDFQCFIAV